MPPPAMTMGAPDGVRSRRLVQEAALGVCLVGMEKLAVAKQRRAIGADLLVVRSHVEIDMRMVKRCSRADAHEFLRTDLDDGSALIIVEMRNGGCGHDSFP
jgi:hypothetical protein